MSSKEEDNPAPCEEVFNPSLIEDEKRLIAKVIEKTLKYNPKTDDIFDIACEFTSRFRNAQLMGLDTSFADELGPAVFMHFAEYVRRYAAKPIPKPRDKGQFDSLVAHHLLTALELLQCSSQEVLIHSFDDLVNYAKSRQSEKGRSITDYFIERGRAVFLQRQEIYKARTPDNSNRSNIVI